jgi:integrase
MNEEDKWISVDKRTKKLVIRFKVKGISKQFYIASGLKDTKKNREIVRIKRDAINYDIALERFDYTLNSYQFKPSKQLVTKSFKEHDILDLWDKYTEFKKNIIEETTILNVYASVRRCIIKLPSHKLDAPKIREYLLNNFTKTMVWSIISNLKSCCRWAVESEILTVNPFDKCYIKKPKTKSDKDEYKAFTKEQRDLIISAFENHERFSHYSPLIRFLFWTGCRPGEAFALTWNDISDDCLKITIAKSCNFKQIKKGTKNGKKRVFPVAEGTKLHDLLIALKNHATSDLIFTTLKGLPITSRTLFYAWNQGTKKNPGVVTELVKKHYIPYYLNIYATRHTFATWAIAAGISPDRVAYWIGDDIATVLKYYCHPETTVSDCPDF